MFDIHYIRQKEPKGLGHAISCDRTFVGDEPFPILLGDDIMYNEETTCLKQLINCYDEYETSILGVQTVEHKNVCKYGIVNGIQIEDRVCKVKGLVKKSAVKKHLIILQY